MILILLYQLIEMIMMGEGDRSWWSGTAAADAASNVNLAANAARKDNHGLRCQCN